MKPVLIDSIPEPLNTWFDDAGYPIEARKSIRTLQHIKSNLHNLYYMNDEQKDALEFWIDTLSLRHGRRAR